MRHAVFAFFVAGLSWAVCTPPVKAQLRGQDVQMFVPPAAQGTTFTIDSTRVPRHMSYEAGLALGYARGLMGAAPLTDDLVTHLFQADALFAFGLFEVMELGVALPLVVGRAADELQQPDRFSTAAGVGDVRLSWKMPLVRGALSVAGKLGLSLPSHSAGLHDRGWAATGGRRWVVSPGAVLRWQRGRWSVGGQLAYRFRARRALSAGDPMGQTVPLELFNELQVKAGGRYRMLPGWFAVSEVELRGGLNGRTRRANEFPVEWRAGARWLSSEVMSVEAGVGIGIGEGYAAPDFRVFTIVRYVQPSEPCPEGPEDYDGFEDGDFCADPDNDGDGLRDENDECPNDAEDFDGFADGDGCPDMDNDADGFPDSADACPRLTEDRDGYQDQDGCPEPDNDEDGVPDGRDRCPMDPEDRDGFEDDDGCPEPGPDRAVVTVTDTRILISERIYFDWDRDTIRPVSIPLLDQVAEVISELSPDKHIRVEGYTDDTGDAEYNTDLSYRRAKAVVEYLVSRGVQRSRLTYRGYGSKHPVASNATPEGRALNRRVEFTIH